VVIAAAIVLIVVLSKHNDPGPHTAVSSPPHSVSVSPTPSASPTPSSSSLLKAAPFGTDCQQAPKSSYDTTAVVEQVVCSGPKVTSSVSAAGVAYAKFSTATALNSWYSTTILKDNGIAADSGNCQTGTTVATTRGADYCEGPFTDSAGAANAREVVVRAPATIVLTNGPNSSAADCPNSDYTLLVFTAPTQNVGAVVLTCSSDASVANAFENSLTNGAFDLVTH
jgi:hypothetical protein